MEVLRVFVWVHNHFFLYGDVYRMFLIVIYLPYSSHTAKNSNGQRPKTPRPEKVYHPISIFLPNSFHFGTLHKRPISTMVFLLTNMLNILSCNGKLNNRWWLLLLLHINIPSGSFSRKVSQCFLEISGVRKRSHLLQKGPICFISRWWRNCFRSTCVYYCN